MELRSPGTTPLHILLVEDEIAHAEIVQRAFELRNDHSIIDVAESLSAARAYLEHHPTPPNLVITDWRLPDGEGLELVAIVRHYGEIPVVVMTSHGNERVAVEAMRTGAIDYVVKSETTLLDMPHVARRAMRAWEHVVERRRAEAALRESETRYRLITENANDVISLLDREGRFIYISPSVQTRLGYNPTTLIGTSAFSQVHPEDLMQVRERWLQLDIYRQAQVVYRCRHADGSWRWLDTQATLIESDPELYAVVVGRDVSEQRQLEAQLYQAQKMDAIGRLAGGVAHDFNNLLVVISGFADLASSTLASEHPIQADIYEIQKAARQATSLTRQLLTFARRQTSEPRLLNVNLLIREMENMLRHLIRENITFTNLLHPDLWPVWADPGQIEQVIINLVINARDALPNGGNITIETTNVVLDDEYARTHPRITPGQHVLLSVNDNGTGMSEEVQRRAFEPFFTTKGVGQGTGLGLATCYGIIQQHEGSVYLYSELGKGTSVKIYLPRTFRTSQDMPAPITATRPVHGTETVLLVEDEPAVRALVARALRSHGYTVIEAMDGAMALELAAAFVGDTPPDLLLTDMVLPNLSGADLVAQLRRYVPHLRVLCMSGYTEHTIIANQLLEENMAFIQKPFTTVALLQKVRETLEA